VNYLLDTNVISEMTKRRRAPQVTAWLETVNGPTLHTSVLVLGEIRKGVEQTRRRDPAQAAAFESWLSRLQNEFGLRITPVTAEVAEEWGRFNAVRTVPVIDGLIGATARAHGWTLATRNTKDFAGLDLEVVNPFEWPV
jgi:predicted nucleic acid-binding protein